MTLRIASLLSILLTLLTAAGASTLYADERSAAEIAFAQGDYRVAIERLDRLIATEGERPQLLLQRGQAYRALGHTPRAERDLISARLAAPAQSALQAAATHALAQLRLQQQIYAEVELLENEAIATAEQLGDGRLAAAAANTLGIALVGLDRIDEGRAAYLWAAERAASVGAPALEAAVRRNLARVASDDAAALAELRSALALTERVGSLPHRLDLLLGIGEEARQRTEPPPLSPGALSLAYRALSTAEQIATALDQARPLSLARGALGELYEGRGRIDEAQLLTNQAVSAAQRIDAHDLLLRWEGQRARLLRAQGERRDAIAAYRRAVWHIQQIRQDIPVTYQDGRSSFRETLAPIYLGLADLLLQESGAVAEQDRDEEQRLLREARDTVERIKVSELRDYFQDSCIVARSEGIESLSSTTAVLYPVILPERLELLVSVGTDLYRHAAPIGAQELEKMVQRVSYRLRRSIAFPKARAQTLYSWLIEPFEPLLREREVDTLVFVPDGALRTLPLAALWDGNGFLIERYAVATAPGLTLLEPRSLSRGESQTLLAGLSRPGPVVDQLPSAMTDYLLRLPRRAPGERALRGIEVSDDLLSDKPSEGELGASADGGAAVATRSVERSDQLQSALELPGVAKEIESLSQRLSAEVLMDEGFLFDRFSSEVDQQPYRIVHIASHGFFGGNPEESFIMTYDRKLNMNQLEALLRPKQLAAEPVELLTLSACQTAEGDDRSPLGLSGVALKSGARSALGSLWPVSDEAAQRLIPLFYQRLLAGEDKAHALQQAQRALLAESRFAEPNLWAAFILIGNWL